MRRHFVPCAPVRPGFAGRSALARAMFISLVLGCLSASGFAQPLTLDQAWEQARKANPTLRSVRSELPALEGQQQDTQGLLWNNPQVGSDFTRRRLSEQAMPGQTFSEWNVGLSQTFEVAGQHGFRRQAAQLELDASHERVAEIALQLRGELEQRFTRVLVLQKRIETEREALRLIEIAAEVVRKRVGAGEDSRLDGNLAVVESERTKNQLTLLEEQLIRARTELAVFIQSPPGELPVLVGEIKSGPLDYQLNDLLERANNRPLFRALNLREQAAESRLSLERSAKYPDVTVGLTVGREGPGTARETLTTLSVSVPLPLFKRNGAGVGRASSDLAQSRIERQTATRDIEALVRSLWLRLESLQLRVDRLNAAVLPKLDENQRLSQISYRTGELGLMQLLLVNRQLLDGRRDYLDAIAEYAQTRIELEQAAGFQPAVSRH